MEMPLDDYRFGEVGVELFYGYDTKDYFLLYYLGPIENFNCVRVDCGDVDWEEVKEGVTRAGWAIREAKNKAYKGLVGWEYRNGSRTV